MMEFEKELNALSKKGFVWRTGCKLHSKENLDMIEREIKKRENDCNIYKFKIKTEYFGHILLERVVFDITRL